MEIRKKFYLRQEINPDLDIVKPIKVYENLHLKETRSQIIMDYPNHTGLYGFKCLVTGDMYIGAGRVL
jgi:hypothetical protein